MKIRQERGITLIALIITIIVLVILAAVSIRAVTNQKIVEQAVNGSQEYANESLKENKILGDTGNLIEDTVAKLNEIQSGPALTFDLNGGMSAEGKTEYKIKLPQNEMTMDEINNYGSTHEDFAIKFNFAFEFSTELAFRKGYKLDNPVYMEDQNGTAFDNITTLTNSTVLSTKWVQTSEAGYNSIVTTNLNGGELVMPPEYPDWYNKMLKALISKGYTSLVITYLGYFESYITKTGYILDGYYYIDDNNQRIDIDISSNLTDEQILALDGKTIYVRWTKDPQYVSITIDGNGGNINVTENNTENTYQTITITRTYTEIQSLLSNDNISFSRTNKVFIGLYRDNACTQEIDLNNLTDEQILALDGSTIYVGWVKDPQYVSITIDGNGGNINVTENNTENTYQTITITRTYTEIQSLLSNDNISFSRTNKVFIGLYRDNACTQTIDLSNLTNSQIDALDGSTIYAGWGNTPNEVSITIDGNGGEIQIIDYDYERGEETIIRNIPNNNKNICRDKKSFRV